MRALLHVPDGDNPTSPGLNPYARRLLHISSLLAIGTLDANGRPWSTLLAGEPGFARSLGQSVIGVKTLVDGRFDPVIGHLLGDKADGEVHEDEGNGQLVSALGLHLATRDRVKLSGKMVAGALGHRRPISEADEDESGPVEVQLVFAIQQSLGTYSQTWLAFKLDEKKLNENTGNCPKYMNEKQLIYSVPKPLLLSDILPLSEAALSLIAKADMFFISSSNHESNLGTNHRGGSPGFVRVTKNEPSETTLVYPELSGNKLYQTLKNLYTTPRAGLVFPDFDNGDALYLTTTTEIMIGKDAAAVLPRSNLVVKLQVVAARFVKNSLSFRGNNLERSPYNPPVRYLPAEKALPDAQTNNSKVVYARLLARDRLTPTIARFRFSASDPEASARWTPGQYVALAFEDELSVGYSHMRDDDPRSLNDDYIRTFTVSSSPNSLPKDEFEITIRNVGTVTNFLFRQNIRSQLEVPLNGFGGSFTIQQGPEDIVPFVAGGIGITPLLAQVNDLDLGRMQLFWTVSIHDIGLVIDTMERCPALAPSATIFISRISEQSPAESSLQIQKLEGYGVHVVTKRMVASDLEGRTDLSATWYLCTGTALRKSLLAWLPAKNCVYEDFNY